MMTMKNSILAMALLFAGAAGYAQPAPDADAQNLQEIVKFTQAHLSDEVIRSYIKSSGKTYFVNGDMLLYLNSQGVSQAVLSAMLAAKSTGPPMPEPPPAVAMTAPPVTPTMDYFQAHLTPYGQWTEVPGVGAAWIPSEANDLAWRPYMNSGHWQFTDAGWFWQSDYTWGDMAFHYGRWIHNEFTGARWAWVPGYDWAPSWVSWREGAGGLGWAPLPWGVEFRAGLGLYWHGALVVDGVGFGLGFDTYVFVGRDHFWGGDYNRYAFDTVRARAFYEHSEFHAGYRMEGGHMMAVGLGREHMAEITHHEVVVHQVVELRHAEETHNFTIRTETHKELALAPVHRRDAARPEAREHAAGTVPERTSGHPISANTVNPANARPGGSEQHETSSHIPEAHPASPSFPATTHPGAPGPNAREATSPYKTPGSNPKLPATKPKSGSGGTNQPPSVPR